MSLLTEDGHSSVDSDDDWSLVSTGHSTSPTHKSPIRESPMSSDRTPGSKSPDSADGSILQSLYAVEGHDSEEERGPLGLGPGMGSQLINLVESRSKKETSADAQTFAAVAEILSSDHIPMESEDELDSEQHQELKPNTQTSCPQEVQHQVKHAPQPEFKQEVQYEAQQECPQEHQLQRPPQLKFEQEMKEKTQQECQQQPQHEESQREIKQELLDEDQHQCQQTVQNPLAVEPTPTNEFWPILNSTVEAANLIEKQPRQEKQFPRRSPVRSKYLRPLKPQRSPRCSNNPIGMLRAAATQIGRDQAGDGGREQVNSDANTVAHAKPGIDVNGGNELMPPSARYIGIGATAKVAQEAVETVPLQIHTDKLATGAPMLVGFADPPRSTVQERAQDSAFVADILEEAPHICGLYNPTMFQPPGQPHRRCPATSASHGSRPASSAPHGKRPATSSLHGRRPATSVPQGGRPATSAAHNSRPATSAPHGSRPATSAAHGRRPATSASHGGRPATSAPRGKRPATSVPQGGRPAKSASHGGRPAVSAPHGSRSATSTPHSSHPATSAPHAGRPATSAPHGSRPATSAPHGSRPATSAPHGSRPATGAPHGSRPATSAPLASRPAASAPYGSRPANGADNRRPGCKPSSSTKGEDIFLVIMGLIIASVFLLYYGAVMWFAWSLVFSDASPKIEATTPWSIGDLPGGYVVVPTAALHTMRALLDVKAPQGSIEPAAVASIRDILNISYPMPDAHVLQHLQNYPGFDMEGAASHCQNESQTWKVSECQWAAITSWIDNTAVDLAKHHSDDKLGSLNINMEGSEEQDRPATTQDTEAGSKDQAASYGERFFRIALIALGFM